MHDVWTKFLAALLQLGLNFLLNIAAKWKTIKQKNCNAKEKTCFEYIYHSFWTLQNKTQPSSWVASDLEGDKGVGWWIIINRITDKEHLLGSTCKLKCFGSRFKAVIQAEAG